MKLRLYEDLADGIISKSEYMEFRDSYTHTIDQKKEALLRIQRERKEAAVTGAMERSWVTFFREQENIGELNRRAMMALIDKIFIYEDHVVEIQYKYRDEYEQAQRYASEYQDGWKKAI